MAEQLDARIQKSQAALLRAGMYLLSKNQEASLSDIAREAEVGRSTLYRLYDTKEQLVKAIAIHCLQVFDAATSHIEVEAESGLHAFHLMFKALLPLSAEMEFLMKVGRLEEDDPELLAIYQQQADEIRKLVEYAMAEGSLSNEIPVDWVVSLVDGLFYTSWISRRQMPMDHDALADLAFQTFCHGVKHR
ncbi:MAG: TetR/AcrR family transcriptional regulator [Pseudomonadota bacterium]